MTAKVNLTLFPAVPSSGCGCGSSCEPRPRTAAADAEALLRAVQAEFGDRLEVSTAAYRTAAELDQAMRSLGAALVAGGDPGWPMSRRNFLVLLESGGPFLALDGKLLAHGVLPPLRWLMDSIRRVLDEKAADHSRV